MSDKPPHPGHPQLTSHHPQHQDFFLSQSTEDFHTTGPASPPYRPFPSSSNVNLNATTLEANNYPPSPAYDSTTNIMNDEKKDHGEITVEPRSNESGLKPKTIVHYPDGVHIGPAPSYHARSDSPDMVASRPPSIAGTDDEDEIENYDWSGEEDLVDEEAKFEKHMGIKPKSKGWGPKRYVPSSLTSLIISKLFLTS